MLDNLLKSDAGNPACISRPNSLLAAVFLYPFATLGR